MNLRDNTVEVQRSAVEDWRVTLVDTGLETMTGGRIKRVREHVGDETFYLTYGDGVSDTDVTRLIAFHREQGRLGTVTAVRQPGRFGALDPVGGPDPGWTGCARRACSTARSSMAASSCWNPRCST